MKTLLLLAASALLWGQAAPSADPVVLTVGAEKITKSQFERIIATLPEQQQGGLQSPEGRRQLAQRVAELKTLAAEARRRKLDQDEVTRTRLSLQSDQVLASALFQELTSAPVDEAALRAYYESHKQESEEVKAHHILIRFQGSRVPVRVGQKDLTETEALAKINDLRAKIVAGAKFDEIAKVESDDTGSGDNGGDLGGVARGSTVPEFDQAVFSQPVGQLGEPVKTQFGYHIIQVDSRGPKSFEEMKSQVEQAVKPDQGQKSIEALVKKNTIQYDEEYFGKAEPAN